VPSWTATPADKNPESRPAPHAQGRAEPARVPLVVAYTS
jgi:hypothetical protein